METNGAPESEIPDKLCFRIGEVSKLLGVEPYVLRFWETEFPSLCPKKSSTGQRLFRKKDVELLVRIKHLLYEKHFTIEGARRTLQARTKPPTEQPNLSAADPLPAIREELLSLLELLEHR